MGPETRPAAECEIDDGVHSAFCITCPEIGMQRVVPNHTQDQNRLDQESAGVAQGERLATEFLGKQEQRRRRNNDAYVFEF